MDDMNGSDAETTKRGPGRPPKAPETPETVLVWVRMTKAVTLNDGSKTKKGEIRQVPLSNARHNILRGLAEWTDPRPDLK